MPAGGALFGSAAAGPGSTGGNKHLIEVRAGKMTLKGTVSSLSFKWHFETTNHVRYMLDLFVYFNNVDAF